ncbi:MAG: M48 family metallopeptidase [Xanthobacteraceae bacterium]
MTTSGPALFFDGKSTTRHEVTVELAPKTLRVQEPDGAILAEWGYDELDTLTAPDDVLRLGKHGNPILERLEVRDMDLARAIDDLSEPVDRSGRSQRRLHRRIVMWTMLATASLLVVAILGLPLLATRLAVLVPYRLERKLGESINAQVRTSLDTERLGAAFECGRDEEHRAGRQAFDKIMTALERGAALPYRFDAAIVRKPEANAVALPGGHVYVYQALIEQAQTPDELAGVIAHELGHVAHRDGVRSIVQGAGLSFMFGMLLGDFVGGGAVVYAATTILKTSYSRQVEAAADRYGVELMGNIGGDGRALGRILLRIAGTTHPGPKLLLDHPETRERVAAIEALAAEQGTSLRPLLDAAEWTALKGVCKKA